MRAVAFIGSYRRGGITEAVVEELLAGAAACGAEVETVWLSERQIAYCKNCRACTQRAGREPGGCQHDDEMAALIRRGLAAELLIFASPVNYGALTAVSKTFLERLSPLAFWQWGEPMPRWRKPSGDRRAVLVTSSMAPALLARLAGFSSMTGLQAMADLFNARTVARLHYGLVGRRRQNDLAPRHRRAAYRLGRLLAASSGDRPEDRLVGRFAPLLARLGDLPLVGPLTDGLTQSAR